jgi:hypothetical protein
VNFSGRSISLSGYINSIQQYRQIKGILYKQA